MHRLYSIRLKYQPDFPPPPMAGLGKFSYNGKFGKFRPQKDIFMQQELIQKSMISLKTFFRNTPLFLCLLLFGSSSAISTAPEIILVGSTPADGPIKSMLTIPTVTKVDFIRWDLKLNDKNAFTLEIAYGESQPNTLGFKDGGQKQTIKGIFTISRNEGSKSFKYVYHLKSSSLPEKISLVKLNENLFHILTSQNQLMIGNGGWSYTLNRKDPIGSDEILISSTITDDKSLQLVFDGRTPCQEIAAEHPEMNASQSCFKLKWRLILNRDSVNYLPTTCVIRKIVDNQPRDVSGKWTIIKGTAANPDAIIYKIEPDKPDESISLLVGDDNVLFFLNKNEEPYIGNKDFSFTLNKKM